MANRIYKVPSMVLLGLGIYDLIRGADAHIPAEVVGHQHCRLQPRQHTNRPVLHAGHIWLIKLFNWIHLHPDQQALARTIPLCARPHPHVLPTGFDWNMEQRDSRHVCLWECSANGGL